MSGILDYFQASRLTLTELQQERRVTEITNELISIESVISRYGTPINDPVVKLLDKLYDFVQKMRHNLAVEIYLTNDDLRQKDDKGKTERDRKVESLAPGIQETCKFIEAIIDGVQKSAKDNENTIIAFRDKTVGFKTFYATQLGRNLLKLAALATLIFLGAEIANHFFPPETMTPLNPNATFWDKTLNVFTPGVKGGAIAGAASFGTYKLTGWGDRFFRSFTSYEQEFVEAAQDIKAARKSTPTPSGGSQGM